MTPPKNVTAPLAVAAPQYAGDPAFLSWTDAKYAASDSAEFQINKNTAGSQIDVDIACNRAVKAVQYDKGVIGTWEAGEYEARGACIMAWTSDPTGLNKEVYARRLLNAQYALDANAARDIYIDDYTDEAVAMVPTVATGAQEQPKVAWTPNNPDGGYVVVWTDAANSKDILAQRFDKTGAKVGTPLTVNSEIVGGTPNGSVTAVQQNPDVAMDNAGNFVVVWEAMNYDSGAGIDNSYGVYGRRYNSNGQPSTEFHVNTSTTADQRMPAVAMHPSGWFVVGWQSAHLSLGADVVAAKFAADGTPDVTGEVVIASNDGEERNVDVGIAEAHCATVAGANADGTCKVATDGTVVITWDSRLLPATDYDAHFQLRDEVFGLQGAAAGLVSVPTAPSTTTTTGDQYNTAVAVNPDGSFTVAFAGVDPNGTGVYYHRFNASGSAMNDTPGVGGVDADVLVNATTASFQDDPSIAVIRVESSQFPTVATAPSFIIGFESNILDGNAYGAFARRFSVDNDGDLRGWDGDNCKVGATAANSSQTDSDNDLLGNDCDNCAAASACTKVGKAEQTIDFCAKAGTVLVPGKLATTTENYDQADTDTDGIGNVCDNCPGVANATAWSSYAANVNNDTTQVDYDRDGDGDKCDTDDDADGVPDVDEDTLAGNASAEPAADKDYDVNGLGQTTTAELISRHDLDSDGDGISDTVEYTAACDSATVAQYEPRALDTDPASAGNQAPRAQDCDGDLLLNNFDFDSDADGIPDDIEGSADVALETDSFGNWVDGDSNGDTVTDFRAVHETGGALLNWVALGGVEYDLDKDTFLDNVDTDMDGDGILDGTENFANAACTDADVLPTYGCDGPKENCNNDALYNWQDDDSDGDGILDSVEKLYDSDNGGIGDKICAFVDLDSDGDGIIDIHESGTDMPPMYPAGVKKADLDGDTLINSQDFDSDDDGILDADEYKDDSEATNICNAGGDQNNCDSNAYESPDTYENWVDDDSDGDGILDAHESGARAAGKSRMPTTLTDTLCRTYAWNLAAGNARVERDCDGDTYLNSMDLDADNDGVVDNIEWDGLHAENVGGTRTVLGNLVPADLEPTADGIESWFDDDADGDAELDIDESGTNRPACPRTVWPGHKGDAVYYKLGTACPVLSPAAPDPLILIAQDADADGTFNSLDFDSDADGILDADENSTAKAGSKDAGAVADGIRNWWDLDSDNDWITDAHESGNDYDYAAHDAARSCEYAGNFDCSATDTLLNAFDLDSDNDGIADYTEWMNGCRVADTLGNDEKWTFTVRAGGTGNPGVKCDADDYENWVDDDSDGDGILDADESGNHAYNGVAAPTACANGGTGNAAPGSVTAAPYMGNAKEDCDDNDYVNSQDADSDGDGVLDKEEYQDLAEENAHANICKGGAGTQNNCDNDTLWNWFDADSDGDGIGDAHENGATRPVGLATDLCKGYKFNDTWNSASGRDCDGDGYLNSLDTDADGDVIVDNEEGTTLAESATCGGPADDTFEPWYDNDSDGDGLLDKAEYTLTAKSCTGADFSNCGAGATACTGGKCYKAGVLIVVPICNVAGRLTSVEQNDCDNDGLPNFQDCDADADGIADWTENAGNPVDGVFLALDSDSDSIVNAFDTDADNDGILDDHECDMGVGDAGSKRCKTGYAVAWTLTPRNYDGANNDRAYNGAPCSATLACVTGTCDLVRGECYAATSIADYLDDDSDNDGIADAHENGNLIPTNLVTLLAAGTYCSNNGGYTGGARPNPATGAKGADCDSDGLENYNDVDSDGDWVSDKVEWANEAQVNLDADKNVTRDVDADGLEAWFDNDADGDGIADATEYDDFVRVDYIAGTPPALLTFAGTYDAFLASHAFDTDADALINSLDLDADADTIADAYECAQGDASAYLCECDANGSCARRDPAPKPKGAVSTHCAGNVATLPTPFDYDCDKTEDYIDVNSDYAPCNTVANCASVNPVDPIDAVEAGDAKLATVPVDTDADVEKDYLDTDADGDGTRDWLDNCYADTNPGQDDEDGDHIGDVCDADYHTCDASLADVSVVITSPVDFQTGTFSDATDTELATTCVNDASCGGAPAHCVTKADLTKKCFDGIYKAAVPFAFTTAGTNDLGLRVMVDDALYATVVPVPASPYTVNIPNGQHRISFAVTNEYGTPYNGCEDARDSVVLRITRPCTFADDCDDGNACSTFSCNASKKCQYGANPSAPGCCNSDYDCGYFDVCYDKDYNAGTPKVCVGCVADNPATALVNESQPGNCPEAKCKTPSCYSTADELADATHKAFTCGFTAEGNCCSKDSDCPGHPCKSCNIDPISGEGTCVKSALAISLTIEGRETCCAPGYDTNGNGNTNEAVSTPSKVDMADADKECTNNDPCQVSACLGNVCRKGVSYFGCCDANTDCSDTSKVNVCNGLGGDNVGSCNIAQGHTTGSCDYSADAQHQGCCFTNTDCVRALIAGKVGDGNSCTLDADCDAQFPSCVAGKCIKKYPQFRGTCDKATNMADVGDDPWYACEYTENPDYCQVPTTVSMIVISEIMADPAGGVGTGGEWVELFNPGNTPIDLKGWYINDSANVGDLAANNVIGWETNDFACTGDPGCLANNAAYPTCQNSKCYGLQTKVVNPGKSFVVCRDVAAKTAGVPCSYVMSNSGALTLDNTGDTIAVFTKDPDGTLHGVTPETAGEPDRIDFVTYGQTTTGYSLALTHPYVDNSTELHWAGQGTATRLKYDASNFGTPLKINSDVFEKALVDDGNGSFIAVCDDAKDCTIGLCNLNAANYCGQVQLTGCCDPTRATNDFACTTDAQCVAHAAAYPVCDTVLAKCVSTSNLSAQCSDGNACSTDTCDSETLTCNNSVADPTCCSNDSQCTGYYPDTLDLDVDLVAPIGLVDDLDVTAIKASFDEIVNKKCVAHKCRYRKNPAAIGGCISDDYALAAFACNDNNTCTKNQCVCSTGAEADCRDGNPADGYYKCDYATPAVTTVPATECCYDNADCADDTAILVSGVQKTCVKDSDCGVAPARCSIDGKCYDGVDKDLSTAELCQQYACTSKAKAGWCDDDGDCTAGTVCQLGDCDTVKHECTYTANPAKAGCCASNLDCINEEVTAEGQNLAYTIDVCCAVADNPATPAVNEGDAVGTNTQLDPLCVFAAGDQLPAAGNAQCVHATGQNFCDTAADCTADVGKRCFSAYCVAHRCRFGLPELDGNLATPIVAGNPETGREECCDPTRPLVDGKNPDCEDNSPCTTDVCNPDNSVGGKGYCTHVKTDPDCCLTTTECQDPLNPPATCVQQACQFDAAKGYKVCKDFDLAALHLCCLHPGVDSGELGECGDQNACTTNVCDTDNTCRHAKVSDACCTKLTECPPTGDACAAKTCPLNGATGACGLAAVPNCLASLPYQQDFEFAHEFYNDVFDDEALVGWAAAQDAATSWNPSDATVFGLSHSRHLRFAPAGADVAAPAGACIAMPKLNTTGQTAAVVAFYNAIDLAAGQGSVTLTVQARQKATSAWENVWTSTTTTDVAETDVYAPIPGKHLNSMETGVRFCLTTGTFKDGGYWVIDDVKVVRGALPTLVTTISDKVVAKGADLLINDVDAYDSDSDTVSYSLVGAPSFVSLVDFHTAAVSGVNHAYVDIQITDAACEGAGGDNIYPITLKISDGFVNVYEVFNVTVTGCSGL